MFVDDGPECLEDHLRGQRRDVQILGHQPVGHLEAELEKAHTENKALEARLEDLEESQAPIEARLDAHEKKLNANKDRVGEL